MINSLLHVVLIENTVISFLQARAMYVCGCGHTHEKMKKIVIIAKFSPYPYPHNKNLCTISQAHPLEFALAPPCRSFLCLLRIFLMFNPPIEAKGRI
jgi:hypothetical protein